ncbi:unnamed protein product [Closterium sp. NIES-54]
MAARGVANIAMDAHSRSTIISLSIRFRCSITPIIYFFLAAGSEWSWRGGGGARLVVLAAVTRGCFSPYSLSTSSNPTLPSCPPFPPTWLPSTLPRPSPLSE